MKPGRLYLLRSLILTASMVTPSLTLAADSWVTLGTASVSVSTDRAIFNLDPAHAFKKIRFYVAGGDVMLVKARLYQSNHQTLLKGLQKLIRKGGYSRTIPLTNIDQQSLKKVELFYKPSKQPEHMTGTKITLIGIPALKYPDLLTPKF